MRHEQEGLDCYVILSCYHYNQLHLLHNPSLESHFSYEDQ
jgi:hypothetical protein